jgi:hypothetical protein
MVTRCKAFKSCLISAHSKRVVGLQQAPVKLFAERQSQKTAKYMASDRGVSFVENRARIQRRFYPNVANFWCSTAGI